MNNINIRHAVTTDVDQIVEMGKEFWEVTPYSAAGIEYNPESVIDLLFTLLEEHYLAVAEIDNELIGFLGFFIVPFPFNDDYVVAQETFFWLEPSYRGGLGKQFLDIVEQDVGRLADVVVMGDLSTSNQLDTYYQSLGYLKTESSYAKVV